ncbi:MAG: hypothetical protein OXE99_00170, partial [Cellvibrionales bacterium]|nr:hypothetical protein [Cellvibrionales bacterium]
MKQALLLTVFLFFLGCSKSKDSPQYSDQRLTSKVSLSFGGDASKFAKYQLAFEGVDIVDAKGQRYPLLSGAMNIDFTSPYMPLEVSLSDVPPGEYQQILFRMKNAASEFSVYREPEQGNQLFQEKVLPVQWDGQPFEVEATQELLLDYPFTATEGETTYLLVVHDLVKSLTVDKNDDLAVETSVGFSPYFQVATFSSYEEASILPVDSIYHPSHPNKESANVEPGMIKAIESDSITIKMETGDKQLPLEGLIIQKSDNVEEQLAPETLHLYQKVLYFSKENTLSIIPSKFLVKIDGEDFSSGVVDWRIYEINGKYAGDFKDSDRIRIDASMVLEAAKDYLAINNTFAVFSGYL